MQELLIQPKITILSNLPQERESEFLRQTKGMIPVCVEAGHPSQVFWLDLGDYHLTEAKFLYSLKNAIAQKTSLLALKTNLDNLASENLFDDTLYPSGFIFFVHRCGSTLLAKSLARSRNNLVLNEATALHEGFWSALSQNWQHPIQNTSPNLNIIRNLILALGRRRGKTYTRYFVKFNPWHSYFIELILQAFPDVPCLFLYRDVAEILASVLRTPAPIMNQIKGTEMAAFLSGLSAEETAKMSEVEYFSRLYSCFMQAALTASTEQITFLNYRNLTQKNLDSILKQSFNCQIEGDELLLLQSQFPLYSKDDEDAIQFSAQLEESRESNPEIHGAIANHHLLDLYEQLEQKQSWI